MKKSEREKRDKAILGYYFDLTGEHYQVGKIQKGSDEAIEKICKKHSLSKPRIYSILKTV